MVDQFKYYSTLKNIKNLDLINERLEQMHRIKSVQIKLPGETVIYP